MLGQAVGWVHPINLLGGVLAIVGYGLGRAVGNDSKIKKVDGGYVATNNIFGSKGITLGHFALMDTNKESTIRQESAHLRQYDSWGSVEYFNQTISSPFSNAIYYTTGRYKESNAETNGKRQNTPPFGSLKSMIYWFS